METKVSDASVLIVVENMSYTFDTRVRKISRSLARSGYRVHVICPRYPGDPIQSTEGNISIVYYPLPPFPKGFIGHVVEYLYSLSVAFLLIVISFITYRFDVIHICNPPDLFFPIGVLCRLLGCKFIFDLHDLCPELLQIQYGQNSVLNRLIFTAEKATVRLANHVLITSRTQQKRICQRNQICLDRVTLVYNAPDLKNFPPKRAGPPGENQMKLVGYVGDMNPQDGIENLLLAAHHIHYRLGRADVRFLCIGDGSAYDQLKYMSERLRLTDVVEFSGRLIPEEAMRRLNCCMVCILPDPKNPFTDSCAMVKSFEYMALSKPFVAYDLKETRHICGDAALYTDGSSWQEIAVDILRLLDNPELRKTLGQEGRRRIEHRFTWEHSEQELLKAYQHVIHPIKTA